MRILLQILLMQMSALAADEGCQGIVNRVIFPLGPQERVVRVEEINSERAEPLKKYTQGASVQDLLQNTGRFGYLAVEKEEIQGFVVAERRANFFLVQSIAVAERSERKGIGSALIGQVVEFARKTQGIDDVRVMVSKDDANTIAFLKANGFESEEIGQKLLMKRALRPATANGPTLQPQLARQPSAKKPMALQTIDIDQKELDDLDPILRASHRETGP